MTRRGKESDVARDLAAKANRLLGYCRRDNWAGYDPYDALNSRLFAVTPFSYSRVARIAFTQVLKRCPINVRPALFIAKGQNPKGLALFLMSFSKLARSGWIETQDLMETVLERVLTLRSPDTSYWCWGYSFPWQTRTLLVPRWSPNLVSTVFVANALLDIYEQNRDARLLQIAKSAGEYLLDVLYWTEGDDVAGFSYPQPSVRKDIHNANFLGSELLCRIYALSGDAKFLGPSLRVTRYSAAQQREDGSWWYSESKTQHWVDNFHTGYNLCALQSIGAYSATTEFVSALRRGFAFYREHFFREDGAPRYFSSRTYPIDIHCVAQSVITLVKLRDMEGGNLALALKVLEWSNKQMWNNEGYYYYQQMPLYVNRIPYMRWSQAWMLLALSSMLAEPDLMPEVVR